MQILLNPAPCMGFCAAWFRYVGPGSNVAGESNSSHGPIDISLSSRNSYCVRKQGPRSAKPDSPAKPDKPDRPDKPDTARTADNSDKLEKPSSDIETWGAPSVQVSILGVQGLYEF